jgi:hypothetical protein
MVCARSPGVAGTNAPMFSDRELRRTVLQYRSLFHFRSSSNPITRGARDSIYDTCANGVLGSIKNEVLGELAANRKVSGFHGGISPEFTSGLCNARYVALALDIVGPDIHDASTWYSALLGPGNIPIVSMIFRTRICLSDLGHVEARSGHARANAHSRITNSYRN